MTKRPNIILLVMDSVRVTHMSCYGYSRPTTPNIDKLARQGTIYEQAISVGCWTLPVHASLFTGFYPITHGLTVSRDALPDNFPTLARQLKEAGYQTASFSNNAYVSELTNLTQGFDTVEELWRARSPRGTARTKMSRVILWLRGFGAPAEPIIFLLNGLRRGWSVMKRKWRRGDEGVQLTNAKIRTWLTQFREPDRPFFLFVNYMEPHEPYDPPPPYDRQFMPAEFSPGRVARVSSRKEKILSLPEKRRREDLEIIRALYDGEIAYLDAQIGKLIDELASLDILDDTVLVITSDHGDSLGEHNHIGHRMSLYEQLVRVPLIIRYPDAFEPGTRVEQQVSLVDLYPTFLELAGFDTSQANANGFFSLTAPPGIDVRPFLVAENTAPKSQNNVVSRMLRTPQYKYIWMSNGRHELYDLARDPLEKVSLIDALPEVASRMNEQLETWYRLHAEHQVKTDEAEYDELLLERLRELGYVE